MSPDDVMRSNVVTVQPAEELMATTPQLSVVIASHNRREQLERAISSVLCQAPGTTQVIVVDDGSTDDTVAYLSSLEITSLRWRTQPNRGMPVARNLGMELVDTDWVAFLDDDDQLLPGWADRMLAATDANAGAVTCAIGRRHDGEAAAPSTAGTSGTVRGKPGIIVAGSFIVRSDVMRRTGGWLPGLPAAHHAEFAVRLHEILQEVGLEIRTVDDVLIDLSVRPPAERPMATPARYADAYRWFNVRHPVVSRESWGGTVDRIAGVAAARTGDWPLARRHLARAVRQDRLSARSWVRLGASLVPPVGRSIWGKEAAFANGEEGAGAYLRLIPDLVAGEPAASDRQNDLAFLPWRYRTNAQRSSDDEGVPFWRDGLAGNNVAYQAPVYRLAARWLRRHPGATVLDIGCGSGDKLMRYLRPAAERAIGIDQPSGVELARSRFPNAEWQTADFMDPTTYGPLLAAAPQLVLCSDVIEHVDRPHRLLTGLREICDASGALLMLSTPDRARLPGADPLGPPGNPRHVREWAEDELRLLVEACGFDVVKTRHRLPRQYELSVYELKRGLARIRHRLPVPDARYSLILLARATTHERSRR